MNLNTCSDREVLLYLAKRFVTCRISPIEGSQFLAVEIIREGLRRFKGRQTRTAAWLGIHRNSLSRWIEIYKIDMTEFRPVGRRSSRKKQVRGVPPWRKQETTA